MVHKKIQKLYLQSSVLRQGDKIIGFIAKLKKAELLITKEYVQPRQIIYTEEKKLGLAVFS